MTGFTAGFALAIFGGLAALGFVAFIGLFHKAINIYRGAGLLTVLTAMAGVARFSYRLVADPHLSNNAYLGFLLGLGVAATALLVRAKHFVPPAMLPPLPPPTIGSIEPDLPIGDKDPFE